MTDQDEQECQRLLTNSRKFFTCPVLRIRMRKTACTDQSTALSRSASANTMLAPLPPSSRLTGQRRFAATPPMMRPVPDSPVKVMRSTSTFSVSSAPAESGP